MSAETRREGISQRILDMGEADFASLAREFGVSEMTVRRDIDLLEGRGLVRRVFGGAISFTSKAYEPPFESRAADAATEKAHIARATVDLLHEKETVVLDSGSTVLAVARAIRGRGLGLTVITPSVPVALELSDEPNTTVLLTGGMLRPGELSLIGPEAESTFDLYNCDTYVMGIAGFDGVRGASEYHREEGSVKRAAVRAADRVIVAADHSKLGRVQLVHVASIASITAIVTDGDPEVATLVAAREAGVQVVCAMAPNEQPRGGQ